MTHLSWNLHPGGKREDKLEKLIDSKRWGQGEREIRGCGWGMPEEGISKKVMLTKDLVEAGRWSVQTLGKGSLG